MKNLLKLEELALLFLGIFLFALLGFPWWWLPVLILLPDISMVGYLAGAKREHTAIMRPTTGALL